ncbi:MAG: zinc ribbon domain-containing protein [Candidatus Binatia bacterium]
MPIYEYHCSKCGDFETMQRMSDKPLTTCPTCRRKVTKLISSTTFHLKGSGWYITDYARKSEGSGGKSDAKGDDKKGDDTKSESATTSAATDTASTSASSDSSSTTEKPAKAAKSDKGGKGGKKSDKAAVA